ncbi:MAG TPA: ABC transporter ATP-binding protein [Acidimicrobiales bacterium]
MTSAPAPAPLTLRSVTKSFGATVAVDGVDLVLGPGELLALVGPSGCGKSTLLRLVAGLVGVDRGEILLGDDLVDDSVRRLDPERRHIGLVFQEHALFPHLTVAQNVAFGLRSLPRRERDQRRDHWLELVGLREHGGRYPHELSGGERQRVALARAMAPAPRLMLLDEPFASLDPNLRAQIRTDVVELLRSTGTPAVFVTHDQTEAMAIGDRVAVMRAGRIEQIGTPVEVFHQPRNRFVAAFMGDASFLPIHANGSAPTTELGPLPGPARPGAVAVVRPDDVTFEVSPSGSAEVVSAEFRGPTWVYTLRLASGAVVQSTRSHLVQVDVGTRVEVSLVPGHQPVAVDASVDGDAHTAPAG